MNEDEKGVEGGEIKVCECAEPCDRCAGTNQPVPDHVTRSKKDGLPNTEGGAQGFQVIIHDIPRPELNVCTVVEEFPGSFIDQCLPSPRQPNSIIYREGKGKCQSIVLVDQA
jgi:hypothetical protein